MVQTIIWSALTMSMFLYGVVLFILGKVSAVYIPTGNFRPLEYAAISANVAVFYVLFLYRQKVVSQIDPQKKNTLNIVCWAMNEWIVLVGFIAVFTSQDGNAFFYLTNLAVSVTGNLLTFPRK